MTEAVTTTSHRVIRHWVESRDGHPVLVGSSLEIDFGGLGPEIEPIDWDEFFDRFEEQKLAFLHQDLQDNGEVSRYNRLVERRLVC